MRGRVPRDLGPGRVAGARIAQVIGGSPAAAAGLEAGDVVIKAGRRRMRDVIDWHIVTDAATCRITFRRRGRLLSTVLKRDAGGDPGVRFAGSLFDGLKRCRNRCLFCFLDGLPSGLRRELYRRDDDYRLSFLYGNFITLGNLEAGDMARIIRDRLWPLYVSVHALDEAVRRELIRPRRGADPAIRNLRRLLEAGAEIHAQIVLCPGFNTGAVLESTLDELAGWSPRVASVGVVPVGTTIHTPSRAGLRPMSSGEAREALEVVEGRASTERGQTGRSWVYAADELYLSAGREPPPATHYDDFPQMENGIGLVRLFSNEFSRGWAGARRRLAKRPRTGRGGQVIIVTGELFAPVLRQILARHRVGDMISGPTVVSVANKTFGSPVTVAGLLTGQDIAAAVPKFTGSGAREQTCRVLVPDVGLGAAGVFLDDMTPEQLRSRLDRDRRVSCGVSLDVVRSTGRALAAALEATVTEEKVA